MDIVPGVADFETVIRDLRAVVGVEHVRDDDSSRALFSQDIYSIASWPVVAVAAPASTAELAQVVAIAARADLQIAPRGGGMSYTSGYIPNSPSTLSLDTARMNRVLEVNAEDMTVTVQAGCTWKDMNDALRPHGLRTPFWGPLSGLTSTVGGGLSQLNAFFGAGHYGTTSESVIGLTVVTAEGRLLKTGARIEGGQGPFWRHYGPDLTGLFCGDCGVFGVKAEITLRLIQAPPHEACASFAFATGEDILEAMTAMARAGLASELCGFDPNLTKVRLKRGSLGSDLNTLKTVVAKQKNLFSGMKEAAKIALAGRNFIEADSFPLHVICEGRSQAGVDADMAHVRRIAQQFNGVEVENTIPKVMRAQPFAPLNSILGPSGERWVPMHGILALSQVVPAFNAITAVFEDMADAFAAHGIETAFLFSTLSTNAFVLEPTFYWPDDRTVIHEATMEPQHLAGLSRYPRNPDAAAVVVEGRRRILAVFQRLGAGHLQIGRTYPYRESLDAEALSLLQHIKATLDPDGRLNPGGLGFDA
jgi:FAD/FMN-containing dehydrogenase